MPSVFNLIPRTAYDADEACTPRDRVRLDAHTRLERGPRREVHLRYRNMVIVEYRPNGDVTVYPEAMRYPPYDLPGLRRIAHAMPYEWGIEVRRRLRPRLLFRGQYAIDLMTVTFRYNGDLSWGNGYYDGDRITWADLNAEADAREGVHPLPSRRRAPRSLPEYVTRPREEYTGTDRYPEVEQVPPRRRRGPPTGGALIRAARARMAAPDALAEPWVAPPLDSEPWMPPMPPLSADAPGHDYDRCGCGSEDGHCSVCYRGPHARGELGPSM